MRQRINWELNDIRKQVDADRANQRRGPATRSVFKRDFVRWERQVREWWRHIIWPVGRMERGYVLILDRAFLENQIGEGGRLTCGGGNSPVRRFVF